MASNSTSTVSVRNLMLGAYAFTHQLQKWKDANLVTRDKRYVLRPIRVDFTLEDDDIAAIQVGERMEELLITALLKEHVYDALPARKQRKVDSYLTSFEDIYGSGVMTRIKIYTEQIGQCVVDSGITQVTSQVGCQAMVNNTIITGVMDALLTDSVILELKHTRDEQGLVQVIIYAALRYLQTKEKTKTVIVCNSNLGTIHSYTISSKFYSKGHAVKFLKSLLNNM